MRTIIATFLFLLTVGPAQPQEFSRYDSKSVQPGLSQPLQWVIASPTAAPGLPGAFTVNPGAWAFAPYSDKTVLPTTAGRDVWLKFTLAATPVPQSWIIRIPHMTVQKVSLYEVNATGFQPVQSAGASLAHDAWTRRTRTPSFEVATSNFEKAFYLRIEHHSPITERPELMSQADFADKAAWVGTLLGLMLGTFGMLLLASTGAYAVARNTVFISLAAFVAATLLHYLVQMGIGPWRMWPGSAYLTQAMQWTAPLSTLAAGCWFFAEASHARDISKPVYRLLCLVALVSLGLALFRLIDVNQLQRNVLNAWAVFVLSVTVASLLWLSSRGMRGNFWLLGGLLPIAAAGASRLAYSYGWSAPIELSLVASLFLTQAGLAWLFIALIWRSRAALSSELAAALNDWDATSGLILERVVRIRLPQMLRRATQLKLGCGVIMLRWLNYTQLMDTLSPERQNAMLKHLGLVLNRVARDIDTAARLDDSHFMILVEGPISRSTLSSLSTQILTACIRASDKVGQPNSFNFHMAIWQTAQLPISADEVTKALKTRLNQMSFGTKRPVQFVDAETSDLAGANDKLLQRRDDLVAKIDAIEALPSVRTVLTPENPQT